LNSNLDHTEIKNKLFTLFICLFGSVFSIFVLYKISNQVNHRPNGFIRLFPPHAAIPQRVRDIGSENWYFAGQTYSHFFLSDYTNTSHLLKLEISSLDTQSITLKLENRHLQILAVPRITIDSPHIFIRDGNTPISWSGLLMDPEIPQDPISDIHFLNSVPIKSGTSILTMYDNKLQKTILAKYKMNGGPIQYAPDILTKQVDGIFCMDGSLRFEPRSSRLVYAYYYRNEFICTDTNLKLLYRGKTLDTNTRVKFSVASIAAHEETKISSPPIIVTRRIGMSEKYIFIQSGLLANNEEKSVFDNSSVIDVYSLATGQYLLSFHLPEFNHIKIRDFSVNGQILVALYDHYIMTYLLQF